MANFGDILSGLTLGASQGVRRNAANSAFEAFTATADGLLPAQSGNSGKFLTTNGTVSSWATVPSGIAINSTAITSGTNNRLLFQSSGNVSQSANLTYDNLTLAVKAASSAQTANIFEAIRYDGAVALQVDDDSSVTLGAVYDYANGKHAPQHIFQYASLGAYSGKGIKIADLSSGSAIRLHTISNGLFITDDTGTAAPLTLATRVNPADASTFTAQSSFWWINSGIFSVGTSSLQGHGQIESFSTSIAQFAGHYNASNYFTATVASNGATTFNAVGSGAKFVFSDKIETPVSMEITGAGQGLILVDGFGGRWEVVVDSFGALNVNSI